MYAAVGFVDSLQAVLCGALRGMGRQGLAATVYTVTYYGVMLPGGIFAAFVLKMGIYGIWGSFGVGTAVACVVFLCVLAKTNWVRLADEALP